MNCHFALVRQSPAQPEAWLYRRHQQPPRTARGSCVADVCDPAGVALVVDGGEIDPVWQIWPAAARMTVIASPLAPLRWLHSIRPSLLGGRSVTDRPCAGIRGRKGRADWHRNRRPLPSTLPEGVMPVRLPLGQNGGDVPGRGVASDH